jgi:hypothetical protein
VHRAPGIPHALYWGERLTHHSGASRRENAELCLPSLRGAQATKQSILVVALDCFAEPVIGRAFARPVGSVQLRPTSLGEDCVIEITVYSRCMGIIPEP